jgi:predicted nucleic acid-binding protein
MAWLLDTNVLSELRRLKPEPKVLAFIAGRPLDELYISVVTLAELRFGIELLHEGSSRRDELNRWLTDRIRPMFEGRIWRLPKTSCSGGGLWWKKVARQATPSRSQI